jgi:hypothetical protein
VRRRRVLLAYRAGAAGREVGGLEVALDDLEECLADSEAGGATKARLVSSRLVSSQVSYRTAMLFLTADRRPTARPR